MAGDWIKFEVATLDKPEICLIADKADIDPDAVVGKLLRIWAWFDAQTQDGNAPSVTKKLLDRSVGVTGFCDYMKSVGWMLEEDGVISLPHFDRHNGETAKARAQTAKRVAKHKGKTPKGNAASVSEELPPTLADALPREEKRRDKDSLSTREPVAMTLDWQPEPSRLAASALRAGVTVDACNVALGQFAVHHEAKGLIKTEAEWIAGLVSWAKRDAASSAARPSRNSSRSSQAFDHDDTSWIEELEAS